MESFLGRYRNLIVLLMVLVAQVIGLAVQVRKPAPEAGSLAAISGDRDSKDGKNVRLIRLWAWWLVMPFERAMQWVGRGDWRAVEHVCGPAPHAR